MAPMLRGLPKIHKIGFPVRTLLNFTTGSEYLAAKKLVKILKDNLNLPNNHTIVNCKDFINKT